MLAKWSGPLEDGCKCEFELVVVGCRLGRKGVWMGGTRMRSYKNGFANLSTSVVCVYRFSSV
jgi:hypothetical protein